MPSALIDGLKAALFDLDGTLVRTFIDFPAMRAAVRTCAASYGIAAAEDDDVLDVVNRTALAQPTAAKARNARGAVMAVIERIEAEGCANPEAVPGASELLVRLHERGIAVAVITRNGRGIAEMLLNRMNLVHDALVAREDVPEFKPHPAPIRRACELLGVAPADSVMIGDYWPDAAAGRAAGVRFTVGIQWPHDPPGRFARAAPDLTAASLEETAALLLG